MIAKKDLINRHNERVGYVKSGDSSYGSEPSRMFNDDGSFNVYNWNGGEGIIRQYTGHLEWEVGGNTKSTEFGIDNGDNGIEGRFNANISWNEDYNYIQVVTHYYKWGIDKIDERWLVDQYLVLYYKNRGCTDMILKNGRLIVMDEYVDLLNIIESTGFKFKMNV